MLSVEQIMALLEQWQATQQEVVSGKQRNLLSRSEHDYHRGLRDAYTALLLKIRDEVDE